MNDTISGTDNSNKKINYYKFVTISDDGDNNDDADNDGCGGNKL